MRVRGKTVLLTGATGGIGHAIAHQLHAEGAGLVLTGRRVEELGALANELSAKAIPADLTEPEGLSRIIGEAGPVDILVANAAVPADGHLTDFSVARLDDAIAVNLRAPMLMAHQLQRRDLSPGFRTCTPQRVARAVIRAIERNTAETIVAPVETRLAVAFGSLAPELNATVQRRLGMSLSSEPAGVADASNIEAKTNPGAAASTSSTRGLKPTGHADFGSEPNPSAG
jgi:short-subunit dehydrogenase